MMRSITQELQLCYREFFESKLAVDLLKCSKHFYAVKKISAAIIKLITANKEAVKEAVKNKADIIAELREPYFGSCYDNKETVTVDEALNKIISILNDENSDLNKVMQIHCIFVYRIYDSLEKTNEKAELVRQLSPDSLFSNKNRSRVEDKDVKATTTLGIVKHSVFAKMLGQTEKKHIRALDKYPQDYNSAFFKSAIEKTLPVVCGPSGHARSLMVGAKLYGDLTNDELKEYACASFAFLAAGGNHSFYEVMVVAKLAGVDFQLDSYSSIVPASIRATDLYKKLNQLFPEFLNSEVQIPSNKR